MIFKSWFSDRDCSAEKAKDRLKLVLAHERSANIPYIEDMKQDILLVVRKYTGAAEIDFKTDSNHDVDTLEVEISLRR